MEVSRGIGPLKGRSLLYAVPHSRWDTYPFLSSVPFSEQLELWHRRLVVVPLRLCHVAGGRAKIKAAGLFTFNIL